MAAHLLPQRRPGGRGLAALRRLRELDLDRAPGSTIDLKGTVLAVIGLGGIVYAFIERGALGWGHPQVWLPLVVGLAGLVAFLVHERSTRGR